MKDWRDKPPIKLPKKIEAQSTELERAMFNLRSEYLRMACGPLPKIQPTIDEMREAVSAVMVLAKVKPRPIIIMDGPLFAQLAANVLKTGKVANLGANLGDNLRDNLRDNLWANLGANLGDNLWDNLGDNLWDNLRDNLGANLGDNLWDNLRDNLRDNLWDNLWDNLGANLGDNLWDNLGANLGDNLRDNLWDNLWANLGANLGDNLRDNLRDNLKMDFVPMDWFGASAQWWICYYDHIANNLMPDHCPDDLKASIAAVRRLFEVGVSGALAFEGVIIVWRRPMYATYDDRNRPHNATGPSVLWQDGYCQWAYHGVDLRGKSWVITDPSKLTAGEVLDEKNVEVRRVMVDIMGKERFLAGADFKEVEAIVDRSGSNCRLLRIDIGGSEPLQYTEVVCPSTGKVIYERVPGTVKTYGEARQWQFDYTEDATIKET